MGVYIIRLTVSGPTSVADAERALNAFAALDDIAEHLEAALCLLDLKLMLGRDNGNACRVIASVLKSFQSLQEYGSCLFFAYEANDSAHNFVSFRLFQIKVSLLYHFTSMIAINRI